MDLKDKILEALSRALKPEYSRLDDDDGISGIVVSRAFEGMSTLDRQGRIGVFMSFRAKGSKQNPLTKEKALQILKKDQYIQVMADA